MNTLKEFLVKRDEILDIINRVGASGSTGVSTFTERVGYLQNRIDANDYTYTNFHSLFDDFNRNSCSAEEIKKLEISFQSFMKDLPEIKEKLSFNFLENFNTLIKREDFVEQWNSLKEEQKSDLLFLDKEIYKSLRTKIDVKEFNFLFKVEDQDKFDGEYPINIYQWIDAPANSKVIFYKLRKEAQDDIHEDFFNSEEVKNAESEDRKTRHKIAVNYLISRKKVENTDDSWYERLDILTIKNTSLHYVYHHFKRLEDEFNGYDKVKENTNVPDILKKWSGDLLNEDKALFEKEYRMRDKELEGKSREEQDEVYKKSDQNYPTIKKGEDLQKGLKKEEFAALVEESKGSEFEDFFNNPMTEKTSNEMPYKRRDYMFIYFRDKFTSETKRKPKFN